jgi:hypothetical protein
MGAMEALNGWLLFGLTTAFLFGIMEKGQETFFEIVIVKSVRAVEGYVR